MVPQPDEEQPVLARGPVRAFDSILYLSGCVCVCGERRVCCPCTRLARGCNAFISVNPSANTDVLVPSLLLLLLLRHGCSTCTSLCLSPFVRPGVSKAHYCRAFDHAFDSGLVYWRPVFSL